MRRPRRDRRDRSLDSASTTTWRSDSSAANRSRARPRREQVRQVALQRAAAFVDEIRSSLEFYTAQAREARISKVLVTGGGSRLEGLLELMRQRIPVPVEPGRVFQQLPSELPEDAAADAEPVLAVAVGLAIPGVDR